MIATTLLALLACTRPTPAPVLSPPAPPPAPDSGWQVVAQSVEGRNIRYRILGHGPHAVLWIGGIHGDEPEGFIAVESLPDAVLSDGDLLDGITLHLIADLNPDGGHAHARGNALGVDLNRNFPADSFEPSDTRGLAPLDQPESAALASIIESVEPELVIVSHSWRDDRFINHDGPPAAAAMAAVFSAESGYRVVSSEEIEPTPGSLGGWVGTTLGRPILTIEHQRGDDPAACWAQTRDASLAVLRAVAQAETP